jgi:hypothetical protein
LTTFEKKVFSATQSPGFVDLMTALRAAVNADPELAQLTVGEPPSDVQARATRFVSAATALLLRPSIELRDNEFLQLHKLSHSLKNLYLASGFKGTDHVLIQLNARDTASLQELARTNRQSFLKALLLFSIDSQLDIDISGLLSSEPRLGSLIYLGLLASKPVTTLAGHQRREALLQQADLLRPFIPQSTDYLVMLSNAWMLCSYAELRGKHRVKAVLNEYLRQWLGSIGCTDAPLAHPRRKVERPIMVVAAEVMHSNHVQYRYFGQYLRQLRRRFELILVTEDSQVDEHVSALYDKVSTFKRRSQPEYLKEVRDLIVDARPDLVFWLSVGMRHWGTALANLRLAPIQFTALGHSASTFSDQIDYYLTEEGYVGDPDLFGEKVLLLPDTSLRFERSPHFDMQAVPQPQSSQPSLLKIALPSNLLKLNPRYIDTLKKIVQRAGRPLSFSVFPNVSGIELLTTRRVLAEALPNVTVYPVLRYQQYMTQLAECHLNLSPFPFGGLHSVVDSLRLGLPVIALQGQEPHSRTDAMLLQRLGLPQWTISHSVEEYIEAASRVIQDDDLRQELSRHALSIDIDTVMFGDANTKRGSEVDSAVWWMYHHHEQAMAIPQRVITQAHWNPKEPPTLIRGLQ